MDCHCIQEKFQTLDQGLQEATPSGPCPPFSLILPHTPLHAPGSLLTGFFHFLKCPVLVPIPSASNSFSSVRFQPKCHFLCKAFVDPDRKIKSPSPWFLPSKCLVLILCNYWLQLKHTIKKLWFYIRLLSLEYKLCERWHLSDSLEHLLRSSNVVWLQ